MAALPDRDPKPDRIRKEGHPPARGRGGWWRFRRVATVLSLGVMAASGCSAAAGSKGEEANHWMPTPGLSWQIQYDGPIDTDVEAEVFDLDWQDTPAETARALKDRGKRLICYINAGAWENWRADSKAFPSAVIGKTMADWPAEKWLDIRRHEVLLPLMIARINTCRLKGFDAIDPDNIDGYTQDTGFPLTKQNAQTYFEALAAAAHERGLSIGLKNAQGLLAQSSRIADFAVNEQCLQYHDCDAYGSLLGAGKAVFHIEYKGTLEQVCAASPAGFSTIMKPVKLTAQRRSCP